jgi:Ca2+-transporting ATPase
MRSVLTAVQLLWVNLIMDTFAALALATDPPTEKILNRPPQGKKAPLITTNMWKMIIGQAIFQLAVTFTLYFAGPQIFPSYSDIELRTVVFNTFVWMQIFNEFNNRRLDNRFNIFEGLHRNQFFIVINILMVGLQVAIIFVGGRVFSVNPSGLNGPQWAVSIVLALLCMPWAVVVRLFPDAWFARIARIVGGPVAVAYRALGRFFSRIGRLFKKNKKTADEEATGSEQQGEPEQMSQRTNSDPVESPVVVVSDTDGSNNNKNITTAPEIMVEDPEGRKGN